MQSKKVMEAGERSSKSPNTPSLQFLTVPKLRTGGIKQMGSQIQCCLSTGVLAVALVGKNVLL